MNDMVTVVLPRYMVWSIQMALVLYAISFALQIVIWVLEILSGRLAKKKENLKKKNPSAQEKARCEFLSLLKASGGVETATGKWVWRTPSVPSPKDRPKGPGCRVSSREECPLTLDCDDCGFLHSESGDVQ